MCLPFKTRLKYLGNIFIIVLDPLENKTSKLQIMFLFNIKYGKMNEKTESLQIFFKICAQL
jgi:hypothetical protein